MMHVCFLTAGETRIVKCLLARTPNHQRSDALEMVQEMKPQSSDGALT